MYRKKRGEIRWVVILLTLIFTVILFGSCKGEQPGGKHEGSQKPPDTAASEKEGIIVLPKPPKKGDMSLEESLWGRKSVRKFSDKKLDDKQLSQIMWAAQGINRPGTSFKTCPSAGATYPLTAYAVTEKGIFRYVPEKHELVRVREGDYREDLSKACLGQKCVEKAPLSVVFTAVYERTTGRYGERGVMYVHMEAGHAAQNIHLQAVALGLGSVPVGAFVDEKVADVMKCGKKEIPLYIVPVGYPK